MCDSVQKGTEFLVNLQKVLYPFDTTNEFLKIYQNWNLDISKWTVPSQNIQQATTAISSIGMILCDYYDPFSATVRKLILMMLFLYSLRLLRKMLFLAF